MKEFGRGGLLGVDQIVIYVIIDSLLSLSSSPTFTQPSTISFLLSFNTQTFHRDVARLSRWCDRLLFSRDATIVTSGRRCPLATCLLFLNGGVTIWLWCGSFWLDLGFQTCLWVIWTTKHVGSWVVWFGFGSVRLELQRSLALSLIPTAVHRYAAAITTACWCTICWLFHIWWDLQFPLFGLSTQRRCSVAVLIVKSSSLLRDWIQIVGLEMAVNLLWLITVNGWC